MKRKDSNIDRRMDSEEVVGHTRLVAPKGLIGGDGHGRVRKIRDDQSEEYGIPEINIFWR